MPTSSESSGSPASRTPPRPVGDAVWNATDDPAAMLDAAVWALAALIGTVDDAVTAPLADVLEANPARTAVLEAAGLVHRRGNVLTPHISLVYADERTARSAVEARLSSLRQAVAAAAQDPAGTPGGGWAEQDEAVLLHQGRASAMTGRALATKVVPVLPGLGERLGGAAGRILDVGTGVAALALALAEQFPHAEVVGIDTLERVLGLARLKLATAPPDVAGRVSLRRLDVADLAEQAVYDLVWLPAPFLSETALTAALPRLTDALKPGGWIVVGTNPAPAEPLRLAVAGWSAVRNGGNSYDTDRMTDALTGAGLTDPRTFPTVQGGPVLVACHRARA